MTTPTKPSLCGNCGYFLDRASDSLLGSGRTPSAGDLTFCGRCGACHVFDAELGIHLFGDEKIAALSLEERMLIGAAQAMIRAHPASGGPPSGKA